MKPNLLLSLTIFLLLSCYSTNGQEQISDTLFGKSYDELEHLFYEWLPRDTLTAREVADAYIGKGRAEKDSVRMAKGYYFYASRFGPEMGFRYADTITALTENSTSPDYPTLGYLLKGYWHYHKANYPEALRYYLKGQEHALKKDNVRQLMKIRPTIATLREMSGDYRGALEIKKMHLQALENDANYRDVYGSGPVNGEQYIIYHQEALFNLSLTYIDLKEIDSAMMYARKGVEEAIQYKDTLRYYWGVSIGGKAEYYAGNYHAALDSMHKAIPQLTKERNVVLARYFVGKSYEKLKQEDKALAVFMEVDSLAEGLDYNFRELRKVYEYLIGYCAEIQDSEKQLVYVNKLLKLDEQLLKNRAMDGEIARKYETPQLLRQKEELIGQLERKHARNGVYKGLMLALTVVFVVLLLYYYRKQHLYKTRYKALLSGDMPGTEDRREADERTVADSGVPEEVFKVIEKGLQDFETKKQFTNPDVSLRGLAGKLNTNSTYLSRVINTTRQKNFSQYLHGLRIREIVSRLQHEPRLRTYSIQGLSEEAGYRSPQSFTNAFYRQTGIYPSYFIKKLNSDKGKTYD